MSHLQHNLQPAQRNDHVDAPQPPAGITTAGIITHIIDGDTVDVEIRRTVRVRLIDCWAPESRTRNPEEKAAGLAAKDHLIEMCPIGTPVILHIPAAKGGAIDQVLTMGRVLGCLWLQDNDPRDVSQRQRDAGHATRTKADNPFAKQS